MHIRGKVYRNISHCFSFALKSFRVTYNQTKSSATLGIDEEERRDGENHLNGTVTQRCVQSLGRTVANVLENGGAVEGDNVDTAHLLGNHDGRGTIVGTPDTGNPEAVPKTGEVTSATGHLELLLVDDVRVVVVSSSDNRVGAQPVHGPESLRNVAVLHEPAG